MAGKRDAKGPQSRIEDEMAADCMAMRIRLVGRTVTGIYDDALRPLGLTVGQLNVLAVVAKRSPVAPHEIAHILKMDKSTVSRTVERMRQHGWLSVDPAEAGHAVRVALRPKGRRLLDRAAPAWRVAQATLSERLGASGAQAVQRAADAVRT